MTEPPSVSAISNGERRLSTVLLLARGRDAPRLINVRANIFVANATRGSTWNWSKAGTVISDVLPVITLIALVARKIMTNKEIFKGVIPLSYARDGLHMLGWF